VRYMHRNVWILMVAGALGLCAAPAMVFVGGILGSVLAPEPELATLPLAAIIIGTAVSVIPVTRLMRLFGRKKVFIFSSLFSSLAAIGAAFTISQQSFWGFNFCSFLLGSSLAVLQQYRFAAMESVAPEKVANAASFTLLGGLISAILGPELAHFGKDMFATDFVGSFCLLAIVILMGGVCLVFYQPMQVQGEERSHEGRPLLTIMNSSVFWVAVLASAIGYAVMSFIMTATPVSMHVMMGHTLEETKWVIQSHIFAMFLPSFFSGWLISVLGVRKLMFIGLFLYAICIAVALTGQAVMHYWVGLVLLGLGWNFLFISGTVLLPGSYHMAERFKVQGFNDFFVFGFQALAALSSGLIVYSLGWSILLALALPLLLIQLIAIYCWKRALNEG